MAKKYANRDKLVEGHARHKLKYQSQFDAYWCLDCELWAEEKCGDDKCFFCADRPETI